MGGATIYYQIKMSIAVNSRKIDLPKLSMYKMLNVNIVT